MEESTYYWLEAFVIIFGIAIIVVGVWYHINYGKINRNKRCKVAQIENHIKKT